jgi:hypothetical protein
MFYEKAVGSDQTKEEKRAWMKANAKVGTTIVILDTQAGLNRYQKTIIERITNRHIYTDKTGCYGGRVWHYSGINTFHSKSQTTLLIPTPEVLKEAEKPLPY